jgi:hypothetical protein
MLTNGANAAGTITLGRQDIWSFTANAGDSINLRLGTPSFYGLLELYGPNGALLATTGGHNGTYDVEIADYVATNSGTFTVLVSALSSGGTGTYVLNLAQMPEPFIVPAGDDGGMLTNGANAAGTITLGDQDIWSFTANKGDSINVRVGTTGFDDYLELFGPNGALLTWAGGHTDDAIQNYTATNSGTFTVMVSALSSGGTGTYVLNLAQMPEPFIVTAGDDGGTLTNGADATGTITLGDQDMWTFTANKGDSINVRLGTTGFHGLLELYAPNGALLTYADGNGAQDYPIAVTATNSGTFTVLVSSYTAGGSGTYMLNLSQIPESFIVPAGYGGGPLTNGANATGTITVGRQDLWTFPANVGDNINVRLATTGFSGLLELYAPNGALLTYFDSNGAQDYPIAVTATNSGTFTVLVSSYVAGGTGTYVLNLSQIPEPFIVPVGDGGGTLTNGANATGTITLGRQDMWSFPANKGDSINVRLGATGFNGFLQLYGPNGALLATEYGNAQKDDPIAYMATNSGTFTMLVSSLVGGTGTYVLNLAQMPEPFVVSSGDQGGGMTGSASYAGTITLGDQDIWAFTACTGDAINLGLKTTNFLGYLELYGPNGAPLESVGDGTALGIAYTATNCGTFTVLVSSYSVGGTGTYGFTANGLSDEIRECLPKISGTNFVFNEVGGNTNANASFILYSTTNVATPLGLWIPVLTNQFDQFGVFGYTNGYNPALKQQYFRFVVP